MTSTPQTTSADTITRPPFTIAAASFVSSFDRFAVTPILVMIAVAMRTPLSATVAAASGYFLAYGLSQPLWGVLSDRYGRVRIMRATLLGAAATGVASALAPDLAVLIASRIVAGACFGAVVPTALTYVGDTVAPSGRQRALTDLMAAQAIATALATVMGGVLGHLAGWRAVFAVPAVCAAVCSFALRGLPEPPRGAVGGLRAHLGSVLRRKWALLVFALGFVEGGVLLGTMTFLASALEHHGVGSAIAGLATAAYGVGVGILSRLVKRLSQRWRPWWLIAAGGTQMCLGYALVAARVDIATVVVTALLLGGGWAFMHSTLQTWATSVAPEARGTAVSFFAAAMFVGSALASAAAGPLAQHQWYALLFGIAALLTAPLTVVATATRRRYRAPAA
ncbi:MAG TPA: MFS transporter [Streptosporangiaceae bacterium]|jgi:predicted MFS family arabinose efflux permease